MNQPSTRVLVVAAVAVAAVLGSVGGVVLEDRRDLVTTLQDETAAPVTIGAVTDALEQPPEGWDFEVPVFNASQLPLRARIASLEGIVDTVTPEPATSISPGSWGVLGFSVAVNCDASATGLVQHARVSVRGDDSDGEVRLALPGEGKVLVEYHRDLCRPGTAVSRERLAGVWMLDRGYGEDLTGFLGLMMWRFGRDGSFVADPEGGLFTNDTAIHGTYRIQGDLLTIDSDGGYACGPESNVIWRVSLDANDRMILGWLRGDCPGGELGDLWVMRRVLLDAGLPGPR